MISKQTGKWKNSPSLWTVSVWHAFWQLSLPYFLNPVFLQRRNVFAGAPHIYSLIFWSKLRLLSTGLSFLPLGNCWCYNRFPWLGKAAKSTFSSLWWAVILLIRCKAEKRGGEEGKQNFMIQSSGASKSCKLGLRVILLFFPLFHQVTRERALWMYY